MWSSSNIGMTEALIQQTASLNDNGSDLFDIAPGGKAITVALGIPLETSKFIIDASNEQIDASDDKVAVSKGYLYEKLQNISGIVSDDFYTKEQTDAKYETITDANTIKSTMNTKADANDVYTKEEADDMFVAKEDIHPPATPTAIDYSSQIVQIDNMGMNDMKFLLLEPSADNYDGTHISIWSFNLKFGWKNRNMAIVNAIDEMAYLRFMIIRCYNDGSNKEDVIANCPFTYDESQYTDGNGDARGFNAYLNVAVKRAIPDTYDTTSFKIAAYTMSTRYREAIQSTSLQLIKGNDTSITRKVYLQSKNLLQKYASETYYTTSQADNKFYAKDDAVNKIVKTVHVDTSSVSSGPYTTEESSGLSKTIGIGRYTATNDKYEFTINATVEMATGQDVSYLELWLGAGGGGYTQLTNNGDGTFALTHTYSPTVGSNTYIIFYYSHDYHFDGAMTFTITSLSVSYLFETTIDEYPTKDEVSDEYLSKTEASSTYLSQSAAANYLLKSAIHDGGVGNTNIKLIPYTSGSGSSAVYRLLVKNSSNTVASINTTGLFATNGYVNTGLGIRLGATVDSSSGAPTDTSASNGKWATYLNNVITTTQYPNCSSISTFKSAYSAYNGSGYSFDNFVPSFQVIRDNYYDKSYIDALEARIAALENNS